jgi:hypothetical protein
MTQLSTLPPLTIVSPNAHQRLFHAGNGVTPVGSGLPMPGIFFGITADGHLDWNCYTGHWAAHTGNRIGTNWGSFMHVVGCGDGVIMAVDRDGTLRWYRYDGQGEADPSGNLGWHPNSGHAIGNGWQRFRHVFAFPKAGRPTSRLTIFGVDEAGKLFWYSYTGEGEKDPSGTLGWAAGSGNQIGNGWSQFRQIHGSGNTIFAVHDDGRLLWYRYSGHGQPDPTGNIGWDTKSGNPIGNGWQGMKHVFGGVDDIGGFGNVIMAANEFGKLFWYKYSGSGESDISGTKGWEPQSGKAIGTGW